MINVQKKILIKREMNTDKMFLNRKGLMIIIVRFDYLEERGEKEMSLIIFKFMDFLYK